MAVAGKLSNRLSPVSSGCGRFAHIAPALVLSVLCLVHRPTAVFAEPAARPGATAQTGRTPDSVVKFDMRLEAASLPSDVRDMVDAILAATHSGNIADLAGPIEWNEMRPMFDDEPGGGATAELIDKLRKVSRDGQGHEVLAILADLLSVGPAQLPLGRDFENNTVYVWPYLAELPLDKLTPAQEVDLYRLVPADRIDDMKKAGKWTWYRLVIGADGTWHSFMPHP